jgi:hypothetical protein
MAEGVAAGAGQGTDGKDGRSDEEQHPTTMVAAPIPVAAGFDYTTLPSDIGVEAKAAADHIRGLLCGAQIDVGTELLRIKEKLPPGEFGKWLKAEFALSERSAQNYMNAAALAAKSATVADLRPGVLYQLAARSTPEAAREAVIGQLTAGASVSDSDIKKIIDDAKHEQEQERRRAEEAERINKLSPRARKSRQEREAEWKRQRDGR